MIFDINKLYEENIKKFEEIDKIINEEGVSLFGAGIYGKFCLEYMEKNNIKVNYFIDNDITKIGRYINGIEILPKEKIRTLGIKVILISAMTLEIVNNIINSMLDYNVNIISFDKWLIMKNYNRFIDIKNNLYDDKSKYVFCALLYTKLSNTYYTRYIFDNEQYFSIPEFNFNGDNEIFLYAGAYCGDTSEKFIYKCFGIFKHIYAFEPGVKQFDAMKIRFNRIKKEFAIEDNKISAINAALSNKNSKLYIDNSKGINCCTITDIKKDNMISTYTVDSFLNGNPITFLKADIEGEELNMLKGSINTIKKYKPKMAISIYHKPDDLLTIPTFIKQLVPEYNLDLRHHSMILNETVLYCWVNKDQIRSDQIRSDQIRSDQIRLICEEHIYIYNIILIYKTQHRITNKYIYYNFIKVLKY